MKIAYVDDTRGKARQHHAFALMPGKMRERGHEVTEVRDAESAPLGWADVVWVHSIGGAALALSQSRIKKPLVVRMHAMETYKVNMRRFNWDRIARLVVYAEHLKEHFLERHDCMEPENILVIPSAIDLKRFTLRTGQWNDRVALVSEVHWQKGVDQIPAALEVLPWAHIYHIGRVINESARNYLHWELKRCGVWDRYHYEGRIPHRDVPGWLQGKSYLLLPSYTEGQPRAVGEAMACGLKPLVHRYRGCQQQWPADCIWDDVEDLVGMREPHEPTRYRRWIEERYNADLQADRVEALLETL